MLHHEISCIIIHFLVRHNLGLIPTKRSLLLLSKINASSFCRRRLSVIVRRSQMAETMKAAVTFVEQGHVRVGPDVIRDPAYLVTRLVKTIIDLQFSVTLL